MGLDINNKASLLQSFLLSYLMLYSGQVERVSVCCLAQSVQFAAII
jgi:hypothetical protein